MSVDNGLFTNSKLVHQKKQAEEESQVEWYFGLTTNNA